MYDIRHFRPALYVLVLLGITGFSLADDLPALWFFSLLTILLNGWLVRTGRFRPLPRLISTGATLIAVFYIVAQIAARDAGPPLMYVGRFLVFLQLIKLFEQRANRDSAQIIVLSLLLMVAAAINTASLLFGMLMLVYLVLSLYCCLLFHLKVEADRASEAFDIPRDKISPATLRLDQRFLYKSMRRLTGLIFFVSVSAAVATFLFFPRGAGQGVLGQLQFRRPVSMTGFSDSSMGEISRIQQNFEIVAHVSVSRNDKPVQGTEVLYLRGLTFDTYAADNRRGGRREWVRSRVTPRRDRDLDPNDDGNATADLAPSGTLWRQKITLRPTGSRSLFMLPGPVRIRLDRSNIHYWPEDGTMQIDAPILPINYDVSSINAPSRISLLEDSIDLVTLPAEWIASDPAILNQIREYVMRPEVTDGLAAQRGRLKPTHELDREIARKIEQHLKSQFGYTLDLTGSIKEMSEGDPNVMFLTKVRKGHCEYFARAMVLMCQSLNIKARIVRGFKVDSEAYNVMTGTYIVRQAHAHEWVEVYLPTIVDNDVGSPGTELEFAL